MLGLNGAMLSGGFTVGALVGGTLVSLLGWRAAFFINVPVAVTILVVTPFVIGESTASERAKLDVPGAVTVTGGLLAVIYAVIERSILAAVVGVLLLVAFWLIELRSPAPLVPVRILRRPTVKWGNYAGLVIFTHGARDDLPDDAVPAEDVLASHRWRPVWSSAFRVWRRWPPEWSPGAFIGRFGYRKVLTVGMAVQGLATLPLVFLGTDRHRARRPAPGAVHRVLRARGAIVAYTVTGTSGLPDRSRAWPPA